MSGTRKAKAYALALMIAFMLGIAQVASAGPIEDGVAAYERGDYATALGLWRPLANQGNTRAQFHLGFMYSNGRGVAQDYAEALKWYNLAANQGNANAQSNLGLMYVQGQGVAQDYAEAIKWYRLAANQGNANAQRNLGLMYVQGQGVAQDYAEAVKWYRLAANQGIASAQHNLGLMYVQGQGVAQDYAEAVKWYRLAAIQGYARAQLSLGVMYGNGQGVAQDLVEAHMWFNLAGVGGDKDAAKSRGIAEGKMTREQIARAQEMANTCRASNYKQCGEPESTKTAIITPSAPTSSPGESGSGSTNSSVIAIPLQKQGGTLVVPVLINNAITLNFVVDSGAADVSIPADVVLTLMRTGTLKKTDFLGKKTYVLADGSRVPSQTFRIRSMKVGDRVVENVTGAVAPVQGSLLLGQSFLGRFKSWSIDNGKQALLLDPY